MGAKGLWEISTGIANAALSQLSYIPKHRLLLIKSGFQVKFARDRKGEKWTLMAGKSRRMPTSPWYK